MREVSNETILQASPPRVWTVLSSFHEFERWNPYVRPSGPAVPEAVVEYSFRSNAKKRHFWTVDACLTACDPPARLAFRFGLGWLVSFEESYAIYGDPVGSRLVHSFRTTGLLSNLPLKSMKRTFRKILEVSDRGLQRHLVRTRSNPTARKKVRKGFRPSQ